MIQITRNNEDMWMDFAEQKIKNRVRIDWPAVAIYSAITAGTSLFWIGVILWLS